MPEQISKASGGDLFIVDNSDTDWKVKNYLHEWADIANAMDIATGFFEIGSLLALDGQWQKLKNIRILMGSEMSRRTRDALVTGVNTKLDESIEREKESNDFLTGVDAIVEAIRTEQILARVYTKAKFHAKAYITHSKYSVVGSSALVGSSNFTVPGLTENIELNIQIRREVEELQKWYEHYWQQSQDITPDILQVIQRHTQPFTPFQIYAKALHEFFRGHELTAGEWERTQSVVFPILDQYQKEGYQALMKIARQHNGAFLCDGVGLGKTFIGLMLIERLALFERKRVVLFVPKAARVPVWERTLRRYLPNLLGVYSNFVIFSHTDLNRGGKTEDDLENIKSMADVVIIDEAHHFRNPGTKGEGRKKPSRYRKLYELIGDKTTFMLTATPVNNRLIDLQHMIELFARDRSDYFKAAPLGIHSLQGHFRKMEKELDRLLLGGPVEAEEPAQAKLEFDTNEVEAEQVLQGDPLFNALVVQRSRAYVKQSQAQNEGRVAAFPVREDPQVWPYSIKKTYGNLLDLLDKAFSKKHPLFSLAFYYPLGYYKGNDTNVDPLEENRQKQVVALVRTMFLKRFESSVCSFEISCQRLLIKMLAWVTKNSTTDSEQRRLTRWKDQHAELLGQVQQYALDFEGGERDDVDEDIVPPEMLEDVEELPREEYRVEEILAETYLDLDQVADFLIELKKFKPSQDDKLLGLIKLLKTDTVLRKHKVLIFTEFSDTARYLKRQLIEAGIKGVDEVDSGDSRDRSEVLRRFAPYYNDSSSAELARDGLTEIRVLIATDVLSEGLNLQDATRLINYDLHWNPVRLMQRIGRVDRRMNPAIESRIVADHPDHAALRGHVAYWNFLPPDELESILRLYKRVAHKTLKISKTFGIEGRKLLTPDDEFEALKDFNHSYEGDTTLIEKMHLEYQGLIRDNPDLPNQLAALPKKVFSGKQNPEAGARAVFFCYSLPGQDSMAATDASVEEQWTEEAGFTRWYLYDVATEKILEDPTAIAELIRSTPETPTKIVLDRAVLTGIRSKLDKHLKDSYLRRVQAPVGVKPTLKAWMELS